MFCDTPQLAAGSFIRSVSDIAFRGICMAQVDHMFVTPKEIDMPVGALEGAFHSYGDYVRLLIRGAVALTTLEQYAKDLCLEVESTRLAMMRKHLEESAFSIAVVGEFKRGKSTVINALLGSSALPMDVMPATATVTRVVYGRVPTATLVRYDGRKDVVPIGSLSQHITKIDQEAEARAAEIKEAIVAFPTMFCQNNVEIVDTPGLSDEAAMTRLTLDIIPKADAAIYVISALSPFSQTEVAFLEKLLDSVDTERVFFVVTHVDRISGARDLQRLIQSIQRRIHQVVEARRGKGEANVTIFPISAFNGLNGKETHDNMLYVSSGLPDLERALENYLAQSRGAAVLSKAMRILIEAASAMFSRLESRALALAQWEEQAQARTLRRLAELDSIVVTIDKHVSETSSCAQRHEKSLIDAVTEGEESLIKTARRTLENLRLNDEILKNGEACLSVIQDSLRKAVFPVVNELSDKLVLMVSQGGQDEDEKLHAINQRLDAALADREPQTGLDDSTSVQDNDGIAHRAGMVLAFANQETAILKTISKDFDEAFQPTGGALVQPILNWTATTLGNDTLQKGWRKLRGALEHGGEERAEAQLKETRDKIRESLRSTYVKETTQHIKSIFTKLQVMERALETSRNLSQKVLAILERERDHIHKLVEWRKQEIRIDHARQQTIGTHEREKIHEIQETTQGLMQEAEKNASLLTTVLNAGDGKAACQVTRPVREDKI